MVRKSAVGKLLCMFFVLVAASVFLVYGRSVWVPMVQQMKGKQTVAGVLADVGPDARQRLAEFFGRAGVVYPPRQVTLLAIKNTAVVELWAGTDTNQEFIRQYDVKAASGTSGPKLREGDKQVPEGLYKIIALNPNSSFHLSMRLDYPNKFDLRHAAAEGRDSPGSDIFIHGKALSVGCLAMGDVAIEELFVLAADTGIDNLSIAIAPTDPRQSALPVPDQPLWVGELYEMISLKFSNYQRI